MRHAWAIAFLLVLAVLAWSDEAPTAAPLSGWEQDNDSGVDAESGDEAESTSAPSLKDSLMARDFSVEIADTRSTASAKVLQSTTSSLSLPAGMTRS